ncbi:hypothetical protein [Kocuria sabuli]|uniref:hypothetical protein n=1 Tax=Kocuria sabuli TaxID=3071448 RepID=UPI0034D49BD0
MEHEGFGRVQACLLSQALNQARISPRRLWLRYVGLGGDLGELEITAFLNQCLMLPSAQRDLLAWAANTLLDYRFHPHVPSTAELLRTHRAKGSDCDREP